MEINSAISYYLSKSAVTSSATPPNRRLKALLTASPDCSILGRMWRRLEELNWFGISRKVLVAILFMPMKIMYVSDIAFVSDIMQVLGTR
ncbi:hypothetical protein OPV22_006880 [Ensete ventricosum]|uniref:Uncharacterized protein n=1 Tax=Ensete ventricosum TaxID=4639 RepID=A0AAV8RQK6_ENSVE|nr:hypothetical protein OPV22_006880 [Ensete ventricosum]